MNPKKKTEKSKDLIKEKSLNFTIIKTNEKYTLEGELLL